MPTATNSVSKLQQTHQLEKGNYVSFSSVNPVQYQYRYQTDHSNRTLVQTYTGIIEEIDNDTVIIRSQGSQLPSEPSLYYRRQASSVTFLRKKHLYLRCRDSPRKPWYGSVGSGNILHFDLNGKPAGYSKEENTTSTQKLWFNTRTPFRKPWKRIPPSGPFLLLSEDNKSLYKVSNTSTTPVFTEIPIQHPISPPKRIKQGYKYINSPPSSSKLIHSTPLPDIALLQQYTFPPTLPTPPPSPPNSTSTTTPIIRKQPTKQTKSKYFS